MRIARIREESPHRSVAGVIPAAVAVALVTFSAITFVGNQAMVRTTAPAAVTAASASATGKIGPRQAPAPFRVANPDGSTTFAGVGAIVWPAPRDARPSVSMQQALATLETTTAAPQGLAGLAPSSVRLVRYEDQFGPTTAGAAGATEQLAWFAEYDHVRHAISLPIGVSPAQSSALPSNTWAAIVVISATTGTVLDAFDYSR